MLESVRLRPDEAVPLLHALLARVADDLGVRLLAIKGPVVGLQGLRGDRSSSDVDVLVHPDDLRRILDAMVALGWREGPKPTYAMVMRPHAANLLNDLWPAEIDVHHYFPGFLADAGAVFDALWASHAPVSLAGVEVPACDPVGQTAILALHLLRSDPDSTSAALRDLEDRARRVLGPEGVAALVRLAHDTDATVTLRPFFLALGVDERDLAPARDPDAAYLWDQRVHAVGSAPWLLLFAQTPIRRWPRTMWHALMLTDDELLASNHVQRGEVSLTELRWRRIRRGARGLPRAVATLRQQRLRGSDQGLESLADLSLKADPQRQMDQ